MSYDAQKTTQLADLRLKVGLSQKEVALFFGLKDRRTIGEWEIGLHRPPVKHRIRFQEYLLDKLLLRRTPQAFYDFWYSLAVQVWGWDHLSSQELKELFPGSLEKIETYADHIRLQYWGGEEHLAPFTAPPMPAHPLVGREEPLDVLRQNILEKRVPVFAIDGFPGVGKTTLAIAFASAPEVLAHFRDGVLWAGVGQGGDPMKILGDWARLLGFSNMDIAQNTELATRATLVRNRINLKSMLLVLDDVWNLETALALQVGGPNCAHLLTSRLPDITADFAGQYVLSLSELDTEQGEQLISTLAPQLAGETLEETHALLNLSGGLPVILVLVGKYLHKISRKHQTRRLQHAIAELTSAQTRFQLTLPAPSLGQYTGTPYTLYASIDLSLSILDPITRKALQALSAFSPKPNSFSETAALAIAQVSTAHLDDLQDVGILESAGEGRFSLHPIFVDFCNLAGMPEDRYQGT